MREIKFRFWDDSLNEFVNITATCSLNIKKMIQGKENNIILSQFTGLKDKNEKEIYEGDIVIYNRGVGNWTGQRMSTTHEIIFTDEVFAFVMKYGSSYIKLRKHWNYIYEVVGNIYENPQLLSTPTAVL
jgi:uncharacterized phage protein (TIGR01671 family)